MPNRYREWGQISPQRFTPSVVSGDTVKSLAGAATYTYGGNHVIGTTALVISAAMSDNHQIAVTPRQSFYTEHLEVIE